MAESIALLSVEQAQNKISFVAFGCRQYDGELQPGLPYDISPNLTAIFLAHSTHPIPDDPGRKKDLRNPNRRYLHRLGDHPLRDAFDTCICNSIVALCKISSLVWNSVGAYRQGFHEHAAENAPVILITVSAEPNTTTFLLAEALAYAGEMLLREWKLHDVHVEVVTYLSTSQDASGLARCSAEKQDKVPGMDPWLVAFDPIHAGMSIGPTDASKSGTLSGFVKVFDDTKGIYVTFAITYHHVAGLTCEDRLASLSEKDGIELICPSAADREKIAANLQNAINDAAAEVAVGQKKKAEYQEAGRKWAHHLESELVRWQETLTNLRFRLEAFESITSHRSPLGKVFYSPKITSPEPGHSLSNWALAKMESVDNGMQADDIRSRSEAEEVYRWRVSSYAKDACGQERIPVPRTKDQNGDTAEDFDIVDFFNPPVESLVSAKEVKDLCWTDEPTRVFIHGRSTPFSVGVLHDMRDAVCTKYTTADGDRFFTSRELVVLDLHYESLNSMTFSRSGDSGAPVRTEDGRLVGFLFGSNERDITGKPSSYLSVAETVLDQIKSAVGTDKVSFCSGLPQ